MLHGSDVTLVARHHARDRIKWEIATLSPSGRPRVPVVGTEWIVIIILEIKSFSVLRAEHAVGI